MALKLCSVLILLAICCYGSSLNVNVKRAVRVRQSHVRSVAMASPVPQLAKAILAVPPAAQTILIPSCLGFVKREYGVSYGYGGAIALTAWLAYREPLNPVSKLHALIHMVYGIRLCAFLLFRELNIPRFREMRERIERNSPSTRLMRAPFILQCALLYFFMSLPVHMTNTVPAAATGTVLSRLTYGALGISALGLAVNIIGDLHKTIAKARGVSLVTGGLFSVLRHPNYTGESFLWTFSTVAALLTAYGAPAYTWSLAALCMGSVLGTVGIGFILAMAATGLEKRQQEHYWSNTYNAWVKRTWGGFTLPQKSL